MSGEEFPAWRNGKVQTLRQTHARVPKRRLSVENPALEALRTHLLNLKEPHQQHLALGDV